MNISFFLGGVAATSFAACALIFLKFWRHSREKLFLCFSISCLLISIERIFLTLQITARDSIDPEIAAAHLWIYGIRLSAFLVLVSGIILKNKEAASHVSSKN